MSKQLFGGESLPGSILWRRVAALLPSFSPEKITNLGQEELAFAATDLSIQLVPAAADFVMSPLRWNNPRVTPANTKDDRGQGLKLVNYVSHQPIENSYTRYTGTLQRSDINDPYSFHDIFVSQETGYYGKTEPEIGSQQAYHIVKTSDGWQFGSSSEQLKQNVTTEELMDHRKTAITTMWLLMHEQGTHSLNPNDQNLFASAS